MRCERCGNEDERFFGWRGGRLYCRKCLGYRGAEAQRNTPIKATSLTLDYELSPEQKTLSTALVANYSAGHSALVFAVTGAGKTELVYQLVENCLKKGHRVGFAVPRVDVVTELLPRFQTAFKAAKIAAVYGGHTAALTGDIVILTCHQLYRYPAYFDLLIMDEIDAFPYRDNAELHHFFHRAVRGHFVLMSATPSRADVEEVKGGGGKIFRLARRYHNHPMPIPRFEKEAVMPRFQILFQLARWLEAGKPVLIFVPTVETSRDLASFLRVFAPGGAGVSSRSEERKELIRRFKAGQLKYLVTTTILERGVTVKDLQVMVYRGDDEIYDAKTLIQIAGRVGRKIGAEKGEVIIYGRHKVAAIQEAVRTIVSSNAEAGLPDLL